LVELLMEFGNAVGGLPLGHAGGPNEGVPGNYASVDELIDLFAG
jgi:hypothetical protein